MGKHEPMFVVLIPPPGLLCELGSYAGATLAGLHIPRSLSVTPNGVNNECGGSAGQLPLGLLLQPGIEWKPSTGATTYRLGLHQKTTKAGLHFSGLS